MAKNLPSIGGASRTNAADANYPEGSAKDVSAPGAGDGTPLLAAWLNQYDAFFQRLMTEAGDAYNDTVDTVIASQFFDAAESIFGGGWKPLEEVTPSGVASFQVLNVPSDAKEIKIEMSGVTYTVGSRTDIAVTVGGTPVAAGYKSTCARYQGGTTVSISQSELNFETSREDVTPGTDTHEGIAILTRVGTTDKWIYRFSGNNRESPLALVSSWAETKGSTPVLAGPLDGLEFTSQAGNFNGGTFNVEYR